MSQKRKQIHVNLWGDEQISDYETVREATGITNDNDLIRHLFREKARAIRLEAHRLIDSPAPYSAQPVSEET